MVKKSFWQRGEDYAKKVSGELIEQIKRGVAPWQKPWKPGEQISAENFSTGQKYSGGNSLYLMSRGIRDGRGDNRWGTYNQIREAGGQVRKGERGTRVLFFTDRTARAAKDEKGKTLKDKEGKTIYEEEQRSRPICKQYTVFNVEQADGLELKPREGQVRPEWDAHRDAEKVIEASGPTVQHVPGDRAYGRRKRQAFLEKRVQSVSAYVAWAHDPGLSAVTTQKTGGPWWMATAKNWMARRRNRQNSVYLHSSIESLGFSRRLIPRRIYYGAVGAQKRYFALKLPLAVDPETVTFVYVDPGHRTDTELRSWGAAHGPLWDALRKKGRQAGDRNWG